MLLHQPKEDYIKHDDKIILQLQQRVTIQS